MMQSNGVPSKVTEERSGSCTILGRHYSDMGCLRMGIRAKEETRSISWGDRIGGKSSSLDPQPTEGNKRKAYMSS